MSNWNTDAQLADDISEKVIFVSNRMKSFLNGNKVFIVVASKGMGKTLLLRYKRQLLSNDSRGIVIVPENEKADYVRLPASISQDKWHLMHDELFWKDLWEISIAISALLNFPHSLSSNEINHIEDSINNTPLPSEIRKQFLAAIKNLWVKKYYPSDILIIILEQSANTVEQIRSNCQQLIFHIFTKYISSGLCLFIDSFDQELSEQFSNNLEIWQAGQHGLMKAAWELSRHNNHVKVYISVRQEAYSSYKGHDKNNMRGSTLIIEYSKRELKELFEKAIKHYEKKDSVEDFTGIKKINNVYISKKEDVFDYIYRHTLGVPRWFMILGEEISFKDRVAMSRGDWQKEFRTLVNDVASNHLTREYIESEMKLFFHDGTPEDYIKKFLSKISSNILTFNNLTRICKKYSINHYDGSERHPFCMLYNLGLLGVVAYDVDNKKTLQEFRKPYEFDWNIEKVLPKQNDTYYLIHPALHKIIYGQNPTYKTSKLLIGDGLSWTESHENSVNANQIRIFVSYSHSDEHHAEEIAQSLEKCFEENEIMHDIWFDKWKLKAGEWVQEEIEKGLNKSEYLILLISNDSLKSSYVNAEWRTMFNKKLNDNLNSVIPVIVDKIDEIEIPTFLSNIVTVNITTAKDRKEELKALGLNLISLKTGE